jgi:hypothetical protein
MNTTIIVPHRPQAHAIRKVHANQENFKLNGTHELLSFAVDVNILG